MNVVLTRCAGLDVHKRNITTCAIINGRKSIAEFGATTGELLRLSDWLAQLEVTHVAMESAGVDWKPVYNLLENVSSGNSANSPGIAANWSSSAAAPRIESSTCWRERTSSSVTWPATCSASRAWRCCGP